MGANRSSSELIADEVREICPLTKRVRVVSVRGLHSGASENYGRMRNGKNAGTTKWKGLIFNKSIVIRIERWCRMGVLRKHCSVALSNNRSDQTTKTKGLDQTKWRNKSNTDRLLPEFYRSASGRRWLITVSEWASEKKKKTRDWNRIFSRGRQSWCNDGYFRITVLRCALKNN